MRAKEIVIRSVGKSDYGKESVDSLIRWFCESLGLSTEEKKESLEEKILKKFIYAAFNNEGLSSGEIDLGRPVPRSTVIYHLNRFIELGIIIKKGRKYYLRSVDMVGVIKELEYDMNREIMKMLDMANKLNDIMLKSLQKRRSRKRKNK